MSIDISKELAQLDEFAKLEPDWDSYGSERISPDAIDQARSLIELVAKARGVAPYAVAPVADGGVYVEWRGPNGKLEVYMNEVAFHFDYVRITDDAFYGDSCVSKDTILAELGKIGITGENNVH